MSSATRSRRRVSFSPAECVLLGTALVLVGAALGQVVLQYREMMVRSTIESVYAEIQPVRLTNCTLERFGEANDGGYLVCGNLLEGASVGYSYGISGYDGWGCDISRRLDATVHEYDCFDVRAPRCEGGTTTFHPECVATTAYRDESGRPFNSVAGHFATNGDTGRQVILKMDVEGAEWDVLAGMSEDTLNQIDQLVMEFHGVHEQRFLEVIRKLKRYFVVAHLHYNNASCLPTVDPHPAFVYELLLVSKRLAVVDPQGQTPVRPSPLDAPNNPNLHDCQNVQGPSSPSE